MNKLDSYIESLNCLENKKVIITGANSGIGFALAKQVLYKGASLVMGCRSELRANKAREELLKLFPNADIDILLYSQDKIDSCRNFVKEVYKKHSDYNCIVLNAGVFNAKKGEMNQEGFPIVSGTNAFGLLAIVDELDKHLKDATKETRVIIQGSLTAFISKYKDVENSLRNPYKKHFNQYNNSKNAVVNIWHYYYKNNKNDNVKYLLCEPGISESNIVRNYPKWFVPVAKFGMRVLFQSAKEGALPALAMCTEKVLDGDYNKPKLFKGIRGLPKKGHIKDKYVHDDMIPTMLDIINK